MAEFAEIKLEKVSVENRDALYRLLQYSLFEESATDGNEMNREAVFEYPYFELYFTDLDRDAYFIKESGTDRLLGFSMINANVQKYRNGHSIAEFLIIPKYRGRGIGKEAAIQCFKMYKGNWEVSPSYGSERAFLFWKAVIDAYTGRNYRFEDGLFLFTAV